VKYTSKKEFMSDVVEAIDEKRRATGRRELAQATLVKCVLRVAEVYRVNMSNGETMYLIPDYDKQTFQTDLNYFKLLCAEAGDLAGMDILIDDKFLFGTDFAAIAHVNGYTQLKREAPSNLIKTTHGVYDLFKNQYVDVGADLYFKQTIDVDLSKPIDVKNPYYQARELMFETWSQGNPDRKNALKFLHLASHIGYGGNRYMLFVGTGGNGKSTYMNMAIGVTGKDVYQTFSMDQLVDDNALVTISPTTRLIVGHELPTNYKFNGLALSRFKALTTGNPISVNRKYLSNVVISNQGVKLQATNDIPRFVGRDNAIDSRLIIVDFGTFDHRHDFSVGDKIKDLTNHSVDELVGDGYKDFGMDEFYATHLNALVHEFQFGSVDDLKLEFSNIEAQLKSEYDALIAETSDDVDIFLREITDSGFFDQELIVYSLVYSMYCEYLKIHNPGSSPLRAKAFATRLTKHLEKFKFDFNPSPNRMRPRTLKLTECNIRECLSGESIDDLTKYDNRRTMLASPSKCVRNLKPKSFFHELSQTMSDEDILQICSEIHVMNDMKDTDFYMLSSNEMRALYEKYKNE
jgi:hypothetical protein